MITFLIRLVLLYFFARVLYWVYSVVRQLYFIRPIDLVERYGKNSWAVITGGSEGIGLAIAKHLAKNGFNLALIARKQETLQEAKKILHGINQLIDIKTISVNFAEATQASFFEGIKAQLEGLDISILVNDMGYMVSKHQRDCTIQEIRDTIVITNCSPVGMSKILLPQMITRGKRCAQIDISSSASISPMPLFATYGAAKTVSEFLSKGLSTYVKNVDILCVQPGMVSTKLTENKPAGTGDLTLRVSTPEQTAEGIFRYLGNTNNASGAWIHELVFQLNSSFVKLVPRDLIGAGIKLLKPLNDLQAWRNN